MKRVRNGYALFLTILLIMWGLLSPAAAQMRGNQRQTNDILRRLNVKIDEFRNNLYDDYSRASTPRGDQDTINDYLFSMQNELSDFQDKVDRRRDTGDDVSQILSTAKNIDDFIIQNRFGIRSQRSWTDSRALFNQLAANYGVAAYWNNQPSPYPTAKNYPNTNSYPNRPTYPNSNSYSYGLTGTYKIDPSRSDNPGDITARAVAGIDQQRRDEAQADLEEKLRTPDKLAIEVRGNQVTMASTLASQITFTADGRDRNETLPDGSNVRLRTTLRGQELTVSTIGGENDYTVTFKSIDNGRSLKITKRVTTDYLSQTVFTDSIYTKNNSVANLDIYNDSTVDPNGNYPNGSNSTSSNQSGNYPNGNPPVTRNSGSDQFVVPNGTILTGILNNDVSTEVSQNNDRFSMTVNAPNQYRGAIIEGYISGINRSGKVSGRSQVTFNFETIRLTNGNTYDFGGFLQSVTDTTGKTIQVDSEGAAKGTNQTTQTAKRGAIGAGIGALIGAIASGGKGAAIGAIIGGGAGAGSVYVQGKDDLEIRSGSSITVQSSSPSR